MTHSNGVDDKDVCGAMPTARHTSRRFTLRLSELHTMRDSFDEFSYFELLNSELHEGLSSFSPNKWRGDFYMNTGTLVDDVSENQSVTEETSIRKKQKLVNQCLSRDSHEIFHSAEAADVFPNMITKQEGFPGEMAASNLYGSVSSAPVAGIALPCRSGAGNLIPTGIAIRNAENGGSCSTEKHTPGFGQKSAAIDGLPLHQICPPTFPDNLPHQFFDVINQIKQAIGSSECTPRMQCGRLRFTKEINQLLVQVENLSQPLTSLSRNMVFLYLSSLLSCEQEFLSKRAKKLCLARNGDALKDPISQLKEEIQNIMPSLIERHNEEILAAERLLMLQLETKNCSASTVTCDGRADEEVQDFGETERMKRITFPRKKFRWNQAIRMRLCEVVQLKMQQFKASKVQSQTAEEYLKAFLDAEIKPLWPRGWIQTRMLFKESRTSHQQWTINLPKLKRMCVFGNKLSRNSSITEKETIVSGSSTSITTSSSISDSTPPQAKTLMDVAKTSCKDNMLRDEDCSGFGNFNTGSQMINNQKWCRQFETFSRTVGSGVSILSPTPTLSPTLATKYWLLKTALEGKTDSRGRELCGALHRMDAVGFAPASTVAFASTSSLTTCSEAAASSVKTQASEFVGRSFEFVRSPGGNGVAEGSGIAGGCGITEKTGVENEVGSVRTPIQELSQHQTVKPASISRPNHSKSESSKFAPEKRTDAVNSPGKQPLSSSCSGFPSIFVFPPGTPLVGLVFCRAPVTSPQPFPAANPNKLQRNPTDASLMRSILCGSGSMEPSCHPLSSGDPPRVPHLGCPRNGVDLELSAKQTVANAPPMESPMLTAAPLVVFPSGVSVCHQFTAPATTQ